MNKVEKNECPCEGLNKSAKRCSDYDDECAQVEDPCVCFIGLFHDGLVNLGTADGYCPLIHTNN